jgi:simple sugar transport system substrate-binding protein
MRSTRSSKMLQGAVAAFIAATVASGCSSTTPSASKSDAPAESVAPADSAATPESVAAPDSVAATTAAKPAATDSVQATQSGGLESGLGSRAKNRRIVFVADNPPSDPFWGTIQRGAQDAAKLFNVELDYQFTPEGADINGYNDLIGTAAASKPAAMAVVVRDPDVLTENICGAKKSGIPVMAYNVSQGGAVGDCIEGFIGQSFVSAGELVGNAMVVAGGIKSGDLVLMPVEQPDASYATQRAEGVKKALDKAGAKYEVIQAGAKGDAEALENMTQWLIGHKDVKAIIPLGGTPHRNALQALKDAGLDPANVAVGGFDISGPVVDGIEGGQIKVAVTQEPYIQGFQAVAELAMLLDFGIKPFSIDTGAGLVTKDNVAVVKELAGKVR